MATQMSFRQQCPSCEAMVVIKDHAQIGRKVACPKCKYGFVVEDPSAGVEVLDDDAPVSTKATGASKKPAKGGRRDIDDDDAPRRPKGKKKGGNGVLIGAVVGGVSLVVLGIGAYFIFFSGDGSDNKPIQRPTQPQAARGGTDTPATDPPRTDAATGDTKTDPPKTDAPRPAVGRDVIVDSGHDNPTNLLPNDSQSVVSIFMDKLRESTAGTQTFESRFGFRPDTMRDKLGISHEEIDRFVRAEHIELGWSFNVIHTAKPFDWPAVKKTLVVSKPDGGPVRGKEYHVIAPNDFLDNIGVILQSELEAQLKAVTKKKEQEAGPLTVFPYNANTLIIAHMAPMKEFLQDNCKPKHLSEPKKQGDDANGARGQLHPGGLRPGQPLQAGADPRKRGGNPVGDATPDRGGDAGTAGGGNDPQFTERNRYLSIEPYLKEMLDKLETVEKDQSIILTLSQSIQADPKIAQRIGEATGQRNFDTGGMKTLGMAVYTYHAEKFSTTVAVEFSRGDVTAAYEKLFKDGLLKNLAGFLGFYLDHYRGMKVEAEGVSDSGNANNITGGQDDPAANAPPGLANPLGSLIRSVKAPTKSQIKLTRKGKTLLLHMDLNLSQRGYDTVYGISQSMVSRMRGMVDMSGGRPRWDDLYKAIEKVSSGGTVPLGTFPRDKTVGGRLARTWPPSQRVSWMAGLLPHLGHDDVFNDIQKDKSWRDETNVKAGGTLVSAFLDPRQPRPTWRARPPQLGGRDLGATHYVGMAGVGDDAADYSLRDVSVVKKLGFFGYDRGVSLKECTDGLANTIHTIQVPPTYQRPWIAGGGATIEACPETNGFDRFKMRMGNRVGTFALMGDGSVRFIAEGINNETFKALCTIKGGETIDDLNKVAPKATPRPAEQTSDDAKDEKKN